MTVKRLHILNHDDLLPAESVPWLCNNFLALHSPGACLVNGKIYVQTRIATIDLILAFLPRNQDILLFGLESVEGVVSLHGPVAELLHCTCSHFGGAEKRYTPNSVSGGHKPFLLLFSSCKAEHVPLNGCGSNESPIICGPDHSRMSNAWIPVTVLNVAY
jgi:hypothetical protein